MHSSPNPSVSFAFVRGQEALRSTVPDLRITQIDKNVLAQWSVNWKNLPSKFRRFSWDEVMRHSSGQSLSIALHVKDKLCGLAYGFFVGSERDIAVVRYIEGAPDIHPLKGKVVSLVMGIVETIAQEKGARTIQISAPSRKTRRLYEQLPGYTFVDVNGDYTFFEKKLEVSSRPLLIAPIRECDSRCG